MHSGRHGRACPGHPRLDNEVLQEDVDGRDKPGHDERREKKERRGSLRSCKDGCWPHRRQKAGLVRDITQALVKNLGVDADAVVIQINEAPLAHKMKGGKTFVERRAAQK